MISWHVVNLLGLTKRARDAIEGARLRTVHDFTRDTAAERLLAVHGCGRKTIREIAGALLRSTGETLGGFERVMKGFDLVPEFTTIEAAHAVGMSIEAFLDVAKQAGVRPKDQCDGRIWSQWNVFSVRRAIWSRELDR